MWYFVSPDIVFGEDALPSLEELTGKRALIVTDSNLVQIGIAGRVTSFLIKAGFDTQIFDKVEPDPTTQTVIKGAAAAGEFKPDWIVGLGGGSPLDVAKATWVLYERPDLQPAEINPFIKLGLREKSRLITIPTTSGTGAEVTWGIVLTDSENQRKMGLGNRENVADIALVDPAMAAGMPPQLTANTGMDALTHAVEGFICTISRRHTRPLKQTILIKIITIKHVKRCIMPLPPQDLVLVTPWHPWLMPWGIPWVLYFTCLTAERWEYFYPTL